MSHDSSLGDDDKTSFTITLTPVAGDLRPPAARLKQLLKLALRACGLRCVALREDTTPADEGGCDVAR